jgi:hypothetical protein
MLRFQRPPDAVFQAILRTSIDYVIDVIADLIENNEYDETRARDDMKDLIPAVARVFPPSLARTTLIDLRSCLNRPELYHLNDYHYLLIYEALEFYAEIHNELVALSKSRKERREASCVDHFSIETIDIDGIVERYFYDIDFLLDAETMLNIPDWFRRTFGPEAFGLSQGLLPHPEELRLRVDQREDRAAYRVMPSRDYGLGSGIYPDYA